MELVSFKAEPSLVVILDQLVSRGIFISRSALIRFALWNKLADLSEAEWSEPVAPNEKGVKSEIPSHSTFRGPDSLKS